MVKSKTYVPDSGDIVWLILNPQACHEQSGRRPALVISPKIYNEKTGLAIFCPITSQVKGYPFEVIIPEGFEIKGTILSDQIKYFDWKVREAEYIFALPKQLLKETQNKISTLLKF